MKNNQLCHVRLYQVYSFFIILESYIKKTEPLPKSAGSYKENSVSAPLSQRRSKKRGMGNIFENISITNKAGGFCRGLSGDQNIFCEHGVVLGVQNLRN